MTFVVFAGTCLLLSPKLLQLLLLAVDLIIAIAFIITLLSKIYRNFNVCKIGWQGFLVSLIHYHFLNQCIGSLRYRIISMICTITYQAISSKQPAYLHSLFTPARQPRQLRSSNSNLLVVSGVKTNVGTRAF